MVEVNWAGNYRYGTTRVAAPESVDELQELIARESSVKALGTRHSFTGVADTDGVLITTGELGGVAAVDHDSMTATVPGGWSYGRVAAFLEREGVALRNMGSLPHISLAGGTATGTHGSGDDNQILAAEISGLELVRADGSLCSVERSNEDLSAMAVGLGMFGIITLVTLDVVPTYRVRQDLYSGASWATVLHNLDEIMASAYSVNLHADFSSSATRTIWQKTRVEVDGDGQAMPPIVPDERWGATRRDIYEIDPGRTTRLAPSGPWCDRLPHFVEGGAPSVGGDELQSEYFVDRVHGADALAALLDMGGRIDPHLHGAEIRTVKADDLWLSPTVGRDCLAIGFTWKKHPEQVRALLPDIEAALEPFGPTAHWGKLFSFDADQLFAQFGRMGEFLALAHEWDPQGKFSHSANPLSALG